MNQHITIRDALPVDAENISTLIHGEARYCTVNSSGEGAELFFSSITPGAITSYITNPNFIYLLGLVGDELAGVVAIRDEKHLYHLFVASKFQRSGIGSFLWMHAKARALESGNADGFTVNSTPFAVPVYERFGFQIQGALVEEKGVAFVPMKLPSGYVSG
ncbi:MAG: GNAT family N-acetyltransferase [Methylobacter sp.]